MHNIVILGSGFAAVAAVRELRKLSLNAEITVVSPDNELVYLPSLIWLPSGKRKGSDLRVSLGNFFQRHHIDRKSTRLNSSHVRISYAVFCLKKKNKLHVDNCWVQTLFGSFLDNAGVKLIPKMLLRGR